MSLCKVRPLYSSLYVHISKHCSKIFFRGWDVAQWHLIKLRQVSGSSLGQTQLLVTQKVEDNLNKKIMKLKNSSFKLIGRHVQYTVCYKRQLFMAILGSPTA